MQLSGLRPKPNRSPAKRVRFEKEEQGSGADGIFFKKCRSKADFAPTWLNVAKSLFAGAGKLASVEAMPAILKPFCKLEDGCPQFVGHSLNPHIFNIDFRVT